LHPRSNTLVSYLATQGEALYRTAVEHGQEGVVGKRADSPYRAGIQPTWRKVKNPDFSRNESTRHPAVGRPAAFA
jgi:ATP-dependent DNA ligase